MPPTESQPKWIEEGECLLIGNSLEHLHQSLRHESLQFPGEVVVFDSPVGEFLLDEGVSEWLSRLDI